MSVFFFVDIILPWRGRGRPCRVPVDEEAASTPHAPLPQGDLLVLLEFSIPSMPQIGFFLPMIPKASQDFTTYWYV